MLSKFFSAWRSLLPFSHLPILCAFMLLLLLIFPNQPIMKLLKRITRRMVKLLKRMCRRMFRKVIRKVFRMMQALK